LNFIAHKDSLLLLEPSFYFSKPFFLEDLVETRNFDMRTEEVARPKPERREYSPQRAALASQSRGG